MFLRAKGSKEVAIRSAVGSWGSNGRPGRRASSSPVRGGEDGCGRDYRAAQRWCIGMESWGDSSRLERDREIAVDQVFARGGGPQSPKPQSGGVPRDRCAIR